MQTCLRVWNIFNTVSNRYIIRMYSPKKCGIKLSPPTLVLIYEDHIMEKTKRRSIPLKRLVPSSDVKELVARLYDSPNYAVYLKRIPRSQIEGLVSRITRELAESQPRKLPQLPQTSTPTPSINSNANTEFERDLNKLGDAELTREKAKMDILFQNNLISRDDKDYHYDVEVDFERGMKLESGWDSADEISF